MCVCVCIYVKYACDPNNIKEYPFVAQKRERERWKTNTLD